MKKIIFPILITAGMCFAALGIVKRIDDTDEQATKEAPVEANKADPSLPSFSEDKEYPAYPIIEDNDGTYDVNGITVSLEKGVETTFNDSGEQIIAKTENGAYIIEYAPVTYEEISEEELRELYQMEEGAEDIESAGGIWTIRTSDENSVWSLTSPETGEDLYSSDSGDFTTCATNVYTNSDGDVAIRTIAYASHKENTEEKIKEVIKNLKQKRVALGNHSQVPLNFKKFLFSCNLLQRIRVYISETKKF